MKVRLSASLVVLALLLTGCVTIPTEGPVREGNADVAPALPFEPFAEGPSPDDSPEAIVSGFLAAAAAGVASDFSVALTFLTPQAGVAWDPGAGVIVYNSGSIIPESANEGSTITFTVPVAATIDDSGIRTTATEGETVALNFELDRGADDQWRISALDDGLVVSEANFDRLFRPVELIYASRDLQVAVPDLRWVPDNNAATFAARELVEGPSPWLADAVTTGFAPGERRGVESVVVADGVATVELRGVYADTADQRALAEEQMRKTLSALPTIRSVRLTVAGVPLGDVDSLTLEDAPIPSSLAAVIAGDRFGFWDGDMVLVTRDDAGRVPAGTRGVATDYEAITLGFASGNSVFVSDALAAGPAALQQYDAEVEAPADSVQGQEVYSGNTPVKPTFDRFGYLWTADAVDPGEIIAIDPDGESVALPVRWLQARTISALAVSRDGARVVVVSRSAGQPVVDVAGVVRDELGVPVGVTEPLSIGTGVGAAVSVAWIDEVTVAVLGEESESSSAPLWLVTVGGASTAYPSVLNSVDMTARHGESSLVLVDASGDVRVRSGSSWSLVATGVSEIAYGG